MNRHFLTGLAEGDFGNGFILRQGLVEGDFWPRQRGCFNIYRGIDNSELVDFEHIIMVAEIKGLVRLPFHIQHKAATSYFYAVRACSGSGQEEQGTEAMVRLSLDETGRERLPKPNPAGNLSGQIIAEKRIRLCWWYWPLGEEASVDHFAVYGDGGNGVISYLQPVAIVPYRGPRIYSYDSASLSEGHYRFGVRSVTGAGIDDGNLRAIEISIGVTAPQGVMELCGGVDW